MSDQDRCNACGFIEDNPDTEREECPDCGAPFLGTHVTRIYGESTHATADPDSEGNQG